MVSEAVRTLGGLEDLGDDALCDTELLARLLVDVVGDGALDRRVEAVVLNEGVALEKVLRGLVDVLTCPGPNTAASKARRVSANIHVAKCAIAVGICCKVCVLRWARGACVVCVPKPAMRAYAW